MKHKLHSTRLGSRSGKANRRANRKATQLSLRRILAPVDFSETSLRAFEVAVPLARDSGARLFLLSVIETNAYAAGMEGVALVVSDSQLVAEAKEKLPKLVPRFVPAGIPVTCLVKRGKPFRVITEVAKAKGIDLIVLTTHGRTGLDRMLMGSTAELVVRHAPCPVYVVRPLARTRRKRRGKDSKR